MKVNYCAEDRDFEVGEVHFGKISAVSLVEFSWVLPRRCNLAGFSDNVMEFTLRIASPLRVRTGEG